MRHRGFIACVAVGLGLGIALFAGATPANAQSSDDFLYDVQNNGRISGPDDQLITLGNMACTGKRQGLSPGDTVGAISGQAGLNSTNAQFIYESALIYLC